MSALPQTDGGGIQNGVEFARYPSRTWSVDKETNRIDGVTDALPSVRQAAEIILHVERFRWQIYRTFSGVRLEDLIGQEADFVTAELRRRVREALTVDDRITGISGFSAVQEGDSLRVSFRVESVYGVTEPVSVSLNGR